MTSDDPVLFEIRQSHLDTGLRGYPVGSCRTSSVDSRSNSFRLSPPLIITEKEIREACEIIIEVIDGV